MSDAQITETEAARLAKTLLEKSQRIRELEAEVARLRADVFKHVTMAVANETQALQRRVANAIRAALAREE